MDAFVDATDAATADADAAVAEDPAESDEVDALEALAAAATAEPPAAV